MIGLSAQDESDAASLLDISVIIVNWNTRALLADCLRSVYDTLRDLSFEVFVVDNASTDGSRELVRDEFRAVHLMANQFNAGFAQANNQAIALAQGRYVLLLNSDAYLLSGSADELVKFADAHPRAGVVGPTLLNPDRSFQAGPNDFPSLASVAAEAFGIAPCLYRRPFFPSRSPEQCSSPAQCDWVGGACLLARGSGIASIGPLDQDYFLNSEEVDWCFRWKEAGWEVWHDPSSEVIHYGGASAGRQSGESKLRLWKGRITFLRKHRGTFRAALGLGACRLGAVTKTGYYLVRSVIQGDESSRDAVRSHWALARHGGR